MHYLTASEHRQVVERLVTLAKFKGVFIHQAGMDYTSLMVCFLMHSRSSAQSLLAMHEKFGDDWFPVTAGYVLVRSLFETDVLAHYISREPAARSRRYIEYDHVLDKQMMNAVVRHQGSPTGSWAEGLRVTYRHDYAPRRAKIDADYARVQAQFHDTKGKPLKSWSGKTIRKMAEEVDHLEAYDVFYADLSSFAHVSVKLADRFLRVTPEKIGWSQRAEEGDVASVFRYAAIFLTCLMQHFGAQFGTWTEKAVEDCWIFPEAMARKQRMAESG